MLARRGVSENAARVEILLGEGAVADSVRREPAEVLERFKDALTVKAGRGTKTKADQTCDGLRRETSSMEHERSLKVLI
jgi:hypothetical protein